MKKIISLALCFMMIFDIMPIKIFAAEEQSLEEIIRPQVEAFAKSIDQKDADGKAADKLAVHGIKNGGKKLIAGENHPLTATLMNSELMKFVVTKALSRTFESVRDMEKIQKSYIACGYYDNAWYDYKIFEGEERIEYKWHETYSVPYNSYDKSLEWIGGTVEANITFDFVEATSENVIFNVKIVVFDKFDFNTANESELKNLIGIIGELLFTPFSWEAKCDFKIEIPIEKPEENKVFGDSDGNGKIDVADAYFARLVSAKLVVPTEEQLLLCDVDLDGRITAIDANIIRKYALGIIKELPVK
ncbi:MAG: hypothetical protein E7479_06335 [Ruminococcaceae bacterium]|nr:hypothetical protein [Oscillospiraceae bacterium]